QCARRTGTRTQVAVTRRFGSPKILRVSCITLVSSSLYPVSGSTFVLCENTLNAYGCGSTFGWNARPSRYALVDSLSSSIAAAPAPDAAWYVAITMRLMRRFWWMGHSGVTATIATQFGLAMMPWCVFNASALISGTTNG